MASYKDSENYRLRLSWPAVAKWPFRKTSESTEDYNCFAYVVGETKRQWCPFPIMPDGMYWPVKVKPDEENTIWPVLEGYQAVGFELCDDGRLEIEMEKIAIYVAENDEPKHVAIQRESGIWQSKLGDEIDVEHALETLESSEEFGQSGYGKATYFMRGSRKK